MSLTQVWSFVRWPLALLLMLAIVNYALPRLGEAAGEMIEFDASGSILAPESESEAPSADLDIPVEPVAQATLEPNEGPVEDGANFALADFYVNGLAADVDNDALIISDEPADQIVIAFPIPPGDPGCMSSMTLTLTATDVSDAVEMGVFASTVDDPASVVDNQAFEDDLRATPTAMATALLEEPGILTLDVLGGFQSYFQQDFAPGRPFVLTLAPTIEVGQQGGVRFVSSEAETDEVPTLAWAGTPGCPVGDATPTPTPAE